ncbi:MAG: flavodoxin domain-containing protein [Clostridium sp.]|uniref:flavodoxin domain-containing protein n=1 Tax=Clostridium sp. TaxID=1506 RepID=UPI00304FAA7E
MNKTAVVVYKSKYGNTKKYAQWIAAEVGADLFDANNVNINDLSQYHTIVYGGGIYASRIEGISLITKNFESIKNRTLVVFTVGITSPTNTESIKPVIENEFTKEMKDSIHLFHLRGSLDYDNMGFMHKQMMKILKRFIVHKKPGDLTDDDKIILSSYGNVVDFIDKQTIGPICSCVDE